MRRIQLAGHHPLGLVGGATGLIGDPRMSGERVLNDEDTVAGWVGRIRGQIERYLDFDGPFAARMVNNLDWTAGLSAIEFLRDVGKHYRMGRMLAKETVAARLRSESGLSFTEFSYQILQGMDYLELYRRYGCTLQTGGNDQWGNLISGTELIHKVVGGTVHALATPLLTKADGSKFGKSEGGAIWLDPEMTSPYAFYQFWVNADDRDVEGYLRVMSFRPEDEIDALAAATAERPQAREAQRALAGELTALVHGQDALRGVLDASAALFGRAELGSVSEPALHAALSEAGLTELDGPMPTVTELLRRTGLASSLSEARRVVGEGGANINNQRIAEPDHVPAASDAAARALPGAASRQALGGRGARPALTPGLTPGRTPGRHRGGHRGGHRAGGRRARSTPDRQPPGTGRSRVRCGDHRARHNGRRDGRPDRVPERPRTIFADPGMTSRRPALHHTPARSAGPRWAADEVV